MIRLDMPRTLWGQWITMLTCVGLVHLSAGCMMTLPLIELPGFIGSGGGIGLPAADPARDIGIFVNTSSDSDLLGLLRGSGGTLYAYGARDGAGNPTRLSGLVLEATEAAGKGASLTLLFDDQGRPSKLELPDGAGYQIDYQPAELVITIIASDGESTETSVPLDYYNPETGSFDRDKVHELEQAAFDIFGQTIDLDPLLDFIEAAQAFMAAGKTAERGRFFFPLLMAAIFGSMVYLAVALTTTIALATVRVALAASTAAVGAVFLGTARTVGSTSLLAAELAEEAAVAGSHATAGLHHSVSAPPAPR